MNSDAIKNKTNNQINQYGTTVIMTRESSKLGECVISALVLAVNMTSGKTLRELERSQPNRDTTQTETGTFLLMGQSARLSENPT